MGLESIFGSGMITSKLNKIINWGRKYSFFPFPFVTACCGMEFMAPINNLVVVLGDTPRF